MPLCVPKYFINCGSLRVPTALAFVMFGIIWGGGGGGGAIWSRETN